MNNPETKYAYRGRCISEALKAKWAANPKPHYSEQRVCPHCGKPFMVYRKDSKKKFCCYSCYNEYSKAYPIRSGAGGKRNHAGRSTRGFFKGLYFTNTDALAFFVYNIHKGYRLYRNRKPIYYMNSNNIIKRFVPDFIDDCGLMYEITDNQSKKRIIAARNAGYQVITIDSGQIDQMVNWCLDKFRINHISELYDNKKISFQYRCACCGSEIISHYERKSIRQYCGRSCAGRGQLIILNNAGLIHRFQKGTPRKPRRTAGN